MYPLFFGVTVGQLDCWTVGLLDCWTVGLLKHFLKGILYVNPLFFGVTVGLLDCWTVGLLDCWTVGLLDSWTFKTLSIAFLVFHILTVFQRYLKCIPSVFFGVQQSKCPSWTVFTDPNNMSTISHLLTFYFRCLTVKMSKLDCWTVGLLDCWTVGQLDCWTVGQLDCWTVGLSIALLVFHILTVSHSYC